MSQFSLLWVKLSSKYKNDSQLQQHRLCVCFVACVLSKRSFGAKLQAWCFFVFRHTAGEKMCRCTSNSRTGDWILYLLHVVSSLCLLCVRLISTEKHFSGKVWLTQGINWSVNNPCCKLMPKFVLCSGVPLHCYSVVSNLQLYLWCTSVYDLIGIKSLTTNWQQVLD